jgi:hypothetical protein
MGFVSVNGLIFAENLRDAFTAENFAGRPFAQDLSVA